jgi:hypothetical protein
MHGIYLCIAGRRRKASKADNPVQAAGAARGCNCIPLYELRSSSTRSGVAERCSLYPELRLRPGTGLSKSDAFRRQLAVYKKYCVISKWIFWNKESGVAL